MAASHGLLYLVLWTAAVIETGHGCPQLCDCDDQNDHHFAECTFKGLSEIPSDLPPNITILRLSANKISSVTLGSLDYVTAVMSLWMANNKIVSIEAGSLAPLIRLRNLDISHNRLVDFPWEDLRNLTALQLLKMSHNELVMLPKDAFASLKDLKSLYLNHNKLITVAQGTFDGLISLSYLQLYDNPFTCNCFIDWLRDWILTTTIAVQEKSLICANPQPFKELVLVKLPQSKCMGPNVTITAEPNIDRTHLYEETSLSLTCEFIGNPKPAIMWRIRSRSQRRSLVMPSGDDVSDTESTEDSSFADKPFKVFSNGTLIIFHISSKDSGNYSCTATNELGTAQDIVAIEVVTLMKPTATKKGSNPTLRQKVTITSVLATPDETPSLLSAPPPPPTQPPPSDMNPEYHKGTQRISTHASKCGLTSNTKYVSNHGFNGSLEDVKQYTFDFGVIALSVSETEARVRLNPLLTSKDYAGTAGTADATTMAGRGDTRLEGLYLCISSDLEHLAVQRSGVQRGVNTYIFRDLRPGTNYSLCLTYTGQDCDIQVLFTTRRAAPNLLVIVSVCIGLLTVSTVPLLGATCYHLVYKYRGKTYQLILKTRDRYQAERDLGAHFHLHATYPSESQRKINSSELEEEEEGRGKRGRQGEEEGSQGTESFAVSGDDCEACSEYSDRLPLGAEAINIMSNYKYP